MSVFLLIENIIDTMQEWLMILLRPLLFIRPATITRRQALAIARAECERRGYGWDEPVRVLTRPREYLIWTNILNRGGNIFIEVDIHTGEVKQITIPLRRIQ